MVVLDAHLLQLPGSTQSQIKQQEQQTSNAISRAGRRTLRATAFSLPSAVRRVLRVVKVLFTSNGFKINCFAGFVVVFSTFLVGPDKQFDYSINKYNYTHSHERLRPLTSHEKTRSISFAIVSLSVTGDMASYSITASSVCE